VYKKKLNRFETALNFEKQLLVYLLDHTAPGLRAGSLVRTEIDQTNYHLRNTATNLTIPKPKREFLKKSVKYSSAMLWNQLPNEAKLAESLHSFKSIVGQRHAS
jgi:hypothetical protein